MLPSLRWGFHRDGVKQIRKLKDGDGQYIWSQGVQDTPDTILNIPVDESEYIPNTFTTGLYVGILGAWEHYWIVDALDIQIKALMELYALSDQICYVGRKETDGQPVLENAFRRVTLT